MSSETNRTPSSSHPAEGERQSIDTLKFRALLSDVCAAYNSGTNVVMREQALIAHINTWAGRQREQGYADQLPRIRHLEHERDMALQAARSAGDAVPAGSKQADEPNVMPPFAAPAGQHEAIVSAIARGWWSVTPGRAPMDDELIHAIAREVDSTLASRCRAQGGITSESSNESCAATPANTAPAVQPEPVDKRADAEVLRDLTKEYDTYMADRAALVMGQSFIEWKDSRMRRGQNSASNGATGEKA